MGIDENSSRLDSPRRILMGPKVLEIVTQVLTTYDHCSHCESIFDAAGVNAKFHKRDLDDYPADLREEYSRLSDWIRELAGLYKERIQIALIDAQSPKGIMKALRHSIRQYPTFVMDGKKIYTGWDKGRLQQELEKHLPGGDGKRGTRIEERG
jgi:hypothetical protein